MRGKSAQIANFFGYHIPILRRNKKALSALRRQPFQKNRRIKAQPRGRDRRTIDVGGKYLRLGNPFERIQIFAQQDGEGIGLFAGRASRYPTPYRAIGLLAGEKLRDPFRLEPLKGFLVTKKARDAYEQVPKQQVHFFAIRPQSDDIVLKRGRIDNLHPPLHAPQKGLIPVSAEVMSSLCPQNGAYGKPRRIDLRGLIGQIEISLTATHPP